MKSIIEDFGEIGYAGFRGPGSVQLFFTVHELKLRPILWWQNHGVSEKDTELGRLTREVKNIVSNKWGNTIHKLYFYQGARVGFPFSIMRRKNKFEFTLYDMNGENKRNMSISRELNGEDDHFTDEEIKRIHNWLRVETHKVSDSVSFLSEFLEGATSYQEVKGILGAIKEAYNKTLI